MPLRICLQTSRRCRAWRSARAAPATTGEENLCCATTEAEDARAHSIAVLGVCGLMLWALVYTLSTKVKLSPRGANAVQKFFPSPRQSWLPSRGSFSH